MTLLAPGAPAAALLGPGEVEVGRVIPWEGRWAPETLAGFDIAIAYTRNDELVVGLRRGIDRVLAHDPAPPEAHAGHASTWFAVPLLSLGLPIAEELPVHIASDEENAAIAPLLERLGVGFLAVHPGSGAPVKNWPVERFGELVGAVAAGRPWLLVEGPADEACARPLKRLAGAVTAKDLPLRVLGALLARAGAYVGNDSGVSHLAAAWGAPTVGLFGPTDPAVWSPLGPRASTLRPSDGALTSLTVAEVEAAIRDVATDLR